MESGLRTFLIADLRDFTRFTHERGDVAAARLADRFASLAKDVVGARAGEVIELRGDEALAVFRSVRQALRAAVELQRRCQEESSAHASLPLNVGIGITAGDAVPVQGGYRTGALNLAARLQSMARAGEIFASETVVELAGKTEGLLYLDRGEVRLKGFSEPVKII